MDSLSKTKQLRETILKKRPLVHHITNFVTMYQCARITSFLGASPIMAFAAAEVGEVTKKADALVVNTGTLNDEVIKAIPIALKAAGKYRTPVVLDPVGLQLSAYRREFILFLLENFHFDVLRCNSSELLNIHSSLNLGSGIDSDTAQPLQTVKDAAVSVAERYHCCVACTGKTDVIAHDGTSFCLERGSELLPRLVGTGCMVNSLIGSFLSVADNAADAAAAGILTMCLAGEAAQSALTNEKALGTFETLLLDHIRL